MFQDIVSELAPNGTIRAGINMANTLLVTGSTAAGEPTGVSPDMAYEIAGRLGVAVSYVLFSSPSEVADAAGSDAWDIALIAAEPARAESIAFSTAYVEIEATYMVPDELAGLGRGQPKTTQNPALERKRSAGGSGLPFASPPREDPLPIRGGQPNRGLAKRRAVLHVHSGALGTGDSGRFGKRSMSNWVKAG